MRKNHRLSKVTGSQWRGSYYPLVKLDSRFLSDKKECLCFALFCIVLPFPIPFVCLGCHRRADPAKKLTEFQAKAMFFKTMH